MVSNTLEHLAQDGNVTEEKGPSNRRLLIMGSMTEY